MHDAGIGNNRPATVNRYRIVRAVRAAAFGLMGIALVLSGCSGPPKHSTWKNATGAEQYERLMWQAARDKNWNEFSHHLAPTFVAVGADGRGFDRQSWVDYWKSAAIKDFSLGEVEVQAEGPDMVVTFVLNVQTANQAMPALRVISVWQQVKRGWILTATSTTPVKTGS